MSKVTSDDQVLDVETTALLKSEFNLEANGKVELGQISDPEKFEMCQLEWSLEDGRAHKNR